MDVEEFKRRYVAHFAELEATRSGPPDVLLERYQRERLMLLGRASERPAGAPPLDVDTGVNLAYVRCEAGKGFGSHSHPGWEIFVPMNGRWRIRYGAGDDIQEVELGPWDTMVVPGGVFHDACNVSDETAVMLGINPGIDTAKFKIAPELLAEIAARRRAGDA